MRPFADPRPGDGRAAAQLRIEAAKAAAFGKPLAAALMTALARVLPAVPSLHAHVEDWPGDLAADGVAFRLNAGLHALALGGEAPELADLYAGRSNALPPPPDRLDRILARVLADHARSLTAWLAHPTQTNEVARVAGLVAALLELGRDNPLPCEVLELGASGGLNLNLAHYGFRLGGRTLGDPRCPLFIAPDWRGRAAAAGPLAIAGARGVDLHPLDARDPDHRRRLESYVWPGEAQRSARLAAALGIAQVHPPVVEEGRASRWLARELARPQPAGVRRVVFHSMVLQYADAAERGGIEAALAAAGAAATRDRPLARVGIEWRADRACVELRITRHDGSGEDGIAHLAAICHPYGEWFDWRGIAP